MSGFGRRLQEILGPVIEAARKVLRDLDADEVPARLRRVARSTDRRLPPPLAAALLGELERDEAFRDRVAAAAEDLEPPARGFLRRDAPGWWVEIVEAVAARAAADAEQRAVEAEEEVAVLEDRLRTSRVRTRAAEDRRASLERDLRRRIEEGRSPLRAALERRRREAEEARAERDRLRHELEELRELLAAARARSDELTRRNRELRSLLGTTAERAAARDVESPPREPLSLARFLDRVAATTAPFREPDLPDGDRPPSRAALALPPGIAPDTPAAVDAVLRLAPRFVVDGHNLIGAADPAALARPEARGRVVTRLQSLVRRGATVTVVFDSALEEGRGTATDDRGVVVRFAVGDTTADDEIVALSGPGTVVVSNDRAVRERAEARGALALWADALLGWLVQGSGRGGGR